MEDKRTALAILLCIVVVVFYTQLIIEPQARRHRRHPAQPPSAPQTQIVAPAPGATAAGQPAQAPRAAEHMVSAVAPTLEQIKTGPATTIETPLVSMQIAHRGGRLLSYKLKEYKKSLNDSNLWDMVSPRESDPLPLGVVSGAISDSAVEYRLSGVSGGVIQSGSSYTLPAEGEFSFKFSGQLPNGIGITKTIVVRPQSYLFDVDLGLSQPPADNAPLWLEWAHTFDRSAAASSIAASFIMLSKATNKIEHVFAANQGSRQVEAGDVVWLSFADVYFMATLIPSVRGTNAKYGTKEELATIQARGDSSSAKFSVYCGPKDDRVLSQIGHQLTRSIDLGWFSFLAWPLLELIRFFYHLLGNFGLAIILLTLVIKLIFLPLTRASFKSMKAMQELQPEMKLLRERIKDPNQLNQEIMALYKKKGVNPMGGCLPILIQIPVFLGLYNALLNSIELRHAPFALWILDLSAPERLEVAGIGLPVMVLLMGASMFLQQYLTPSTGDPAQRRMMYIMTLVFTIIFIQGSFPAGLVLYWLTNNIISIIQQAFLHGDKKANPFAATVVASALIFGLGYVLTLV